MKHIVVIPCRNEAETIGSLVLQARGAGCTPVVCDDSSTDDTAGEAEAAGALVLSVPRYRRGLAGVYEYGLRRALEMDADYISEMDAGGSHDPIYLMHQRELMDRWNLQMVQGSRFLPTSRYKGTFTRWALSRLGTLLTNALHGTKYTDATSGFITYQPFALRMILMDQLESTGHFYQTEMRLRARAWNFDTMECPIGYETSSSSLNGGSIAEALRLVWRGTW